MQGKTGKASTLKNITESTTGVQDTVLHTATGVFTNIAQMPSPAPSSAPTLIPMIVEVELEAAATAPPTSDDEVSLLATR